MSNMPALLPDNVVNVIREFIDQKTELLKYNPSSKKPVGQGVFQLIYPHCDLLYYPIMDFEEENNGCLIPHLPLRNGGERNVIFINTYQTAEKQVFAAAHEFGHYLEVDKYVQAKCPGTDTERIINRFAAEWLMPKNLFIKTVRNELQQSGIIRDIPVKRMLDIVVVCMDAFTVPYNSVVIRMVEENILDFDSGRLLTDGNDYLIPREIEKAWKKIVSELNNSVLQTRSLRKEYVGLSDILKQKEVSDAIPSAKVQRIMDRFDILKNEQNGELETIIPLKAGDL